MNDMIGVNSIYPLKLNSAYQRYDHQGIFIYTNNREKAESIINWYIENYEIDKFNISTRIPKVEIYLKDGRRIVWIEPEEVGRAYRCSEAYIDKDLDNELIDTAILPWCNCSPETIRMI